MKPFNWPPLPELKWHLAGLLGVLLAGLIGFGMGMQGGSDTELVAAPRSPAVTPLTSIANPEASAAIGKPMNSGAAKSASHARLRVWEAAQIPPTDNAVAPLTPEFWKISGLYGTPGGRGVIVDFPKRQVIEYVAQGGKLPNGAKVIAIDAHSMTVKTKVANKWKTIVLDFDANNF